MTLGSLIAILSLMFMNPTHEKTNVTQYPRVAQPMQRDRVLIVAPHIDDESIGAAGYIADARAGGAEVYVVFLTAGDCNRFSARILNKTLGPTASNYLSVGHTRIAEARVAMRLLGVPDDHSFVLGYPDRGLRTILENRLDVVRSRGTQRLSVPYDEALSPGSPYTFDSLMTDVEQVLSIARPTIVIAPVGFDLHPDHSAAAELIDLSLAGMKLHPQRLGYLVHANRIPTWLFHRPARALVPPARMRALTWATYPLTPALQQRKDAVLVTYKSQRPYVSMLRNAFVRTNELFFVYDDGATACDSSGESDVTPARIPIAR